MTETKNIAAYIKPVNIVLDLAVISLLGFYCFKGMVANSFLFWLYQFSFWCLISYFSGYYEVYRFTRPKSIVYRIALQFVFYGTALIAFFIFSEHNTLNWGAMARFTGYILLATSFHKVAVKIIFKQLADTRTGNAIIIGQALLLPKQERETITAEFLYNDKENVVESAIAFAGSNAIGTIYCVLEHIKPSNIDRLKNFSYASGTALRFIPHKNMLLPKGLEIDPYKEFPALYPQKSPLHNPVTRLLKRIFDILFSMLVIVFILSWLTPLLALIIKIESKGPVFFKQGRPGINETEFICYKFRSMAVNRNSETMAVKNDIRITKVGKFIRKTSLDEIPQFINVLMGDMSVVGPRPQLWTQNNSFKTYINKYSSRLLVKPGITGLAQISGNRGEINSDSVIQNRVRYDVFYIENWSMLLDIRIIIQTVVNIFLGEEKAY